MGLWPSATLIEGMGLWPSATMPWHYQACEPNGYGRVGGGVWFRIVPGAGLAASKLAWPRLSWPGWLASNLAWPKIKFLKYS